MYEYISRIRLALCLSLLWSLVACSTSKPAITPGTTKEDQMRSEIIEFARKQLGKPYKYAGRSPKTGFDCSGLTYYVLNEFGITVSPASKFQAKEGKRVDLKKARPGDIIYYKRSAAGPVFHVSMVVSNKQGEITVIHSVSRGVVQENITTSSYWKPKIYGARDVISP